MSGHSAGTCDLLAFFLDGERFPELDAHGIAVIAALLRYVNTSGRGAQKFHARPSHQQLARMARVTEPTVRRALNYIQRGGWVIVTKRRSGKRNAASDYDFTPAAEWIAKHRPPKRTALKVIEGGRS